MRSIDEITMKPIGVIQAYPDRNSAPMQGILQKGSYGELTVFDEYLEGIRDIEAGDWCIFTFYFHLSDRCKLVTVSGRSGLEKGIYSTRSPSRPNGIGISVVRVVNRQGGTIYFEGADMIDGTPLLDIKPYDSALHPQVEA